MIRIFLTLLLLTGIFITSCKKDKCPNGFENMGGDCICPSGKFEGNGMCRELKPNEYYATLGHCACPDTIFFEIIERDQQHMRVRFDLGWGYHETGCSLIVKSDGDSLYTVNTSAFMTTLGCPINGQETATQIFGKFIENDSKIRVTLKYMAYPFFEEELGRCEFLLQK